MQIDRAKRPSGSAEINFSPPVVYTFRLSNGLNIHFSEKNDLPIVRINFLINSGSRIDDQDKKGLCNLLAMCIDEGAGDFSALQLADEFEMLGANFAVSCDNDISIISLQVLTENFSAALKLLGDVLMKPHFNEKDFEREKHKILIKLHQAKAEPDYIADVSFEYFIFGKDSPYAYPSIGTELSIPNIQNKNIKNLYERNFVPSNASMVIVGNLKQDQLISELESVFRDWNGTIVTEDEKINSVQPERKVLIINKPGAVQTEIRTGHLSSKRNENDFFQKQIINLILGGQFSSRLNLNLREKNGYTYGVHSRFNYLKDAGYFAVSTSVDVGNTVYALQEIFSEIEKIKAGITQDELTFSKSSLTKRYPSNFETFRQIAANISAMTMHNLPKNYFETYIDRVTALTQDNINSIAYSTIYPEQLISVLVGDANKILNLTKENVFGKIDVLEFDEVFKS